MKNILLIIVVTFSITAFGQKQYTCEKDVFETNKLVFYGYDFSHFKLAEAKRLYDGNIKKLIPSWIGFVNNHNEKESLQRRLKKDEIIYNFDHSINLLKKLNEDDLVVVLKHSIPIDSIQTIINRYDLKEKEGIGFVVIVECFEKAKKEASAYFTFFDIATKKTLMIDHYVTNDADGHGMTNYWGVGLNVTIAKYIARVYKKKAKEFKNNKALN